MSAVPAALGRCLVLGCGCGRFIAVDRPEVCQCSHVDGGHVPCWASQAQLQAPPASLALGNVHEHCGLPFEAHPTGAPTAAEEPRVAAQLAALRQATEAVQQVAGVVRQLLDVTRLHLEQQHQLLTHVLGKAPPPSEAPSSHEEPAEAPAGAPVDIETIDFHRLHAEGALAGLSMLELKEYCRLQGLRLKGTKVDLVKRIQAHLDQPRGLKRGRKATAKSPDGSDREGPPQPGPPCPGEDPKSETNSNQDGADVLQVQQPSSTTAPQNGQTAAEVPVHVDVHVPARDLADMSSLPELRLPFAFCAVKDGCSHFVEDPTSPAATIPDTEEGRLQHLYALYGKFFKQADLMKKIVFGLADQNRRTNFRHAYAITLWTASGLVSAATVRPLQSTRHPCALEVVCAMTRADQERRGFGSLLLRQVVAEARRLNCDAVYIKAEQSTAPFWRKRGCVPCAFPGHIEHTCLQSTGTVSLKLPVGPEAVMATAADPLTRGPSPPASPKRPPVTVTMRRGSPALQLHMSTS
eukprot:EG_transcript_6398